MNPLHLIWILPSTFLLGYFFGCAMTGGGRNVSHLLIIERLCRMLDGAQEIIRKQAELLAMHGIETDSGKLERQRDDLQVAHVLPPPVIAQPKK